MLDEYVTATVVDKPPTPVTTAVPHGVIADPVNTCAADGHVIVVVELALATVTNAVAE
jgi:hypothetical protein